MNRFWPTSAAILGALLLQVAIAPHLAIAGIVPNLLMLVVVTLAMVEGPRWGAGAGFVAGLAFDLIGTGPIGAMALVLTLVGYVAGSLQANMFAQGWLMPLTAVFIASLVTEVSYALVLTIVGEGQNLLSTLGHVSLPAALYNGVLALLTYPWLARFLRREPAMTTFRRLG